MIIYLSIALIVASMLVLCWCVLKTGSRETPRVKG